MTIGNERFTKGFRRAAQWFGLPGPGPGLAPAAVVTLPGLMLFGVEGLERASITVNGNGEFNLLTVPPNEIWECGGLTFGKVGGTWELAALWINDDTTQERMLIQDTAQTANNGQVLLNAAGSTMLKGRVLYPGTVVGITVTGHSVDGGVQIQLWRRILDYDPDSRD